MKISVASPHRTYASVAGCIAAATLSIVALTACDPGPAARPAAPPSSAAGSASALPTAATVSATGQLTSADLAWLSAVAALQKKIDGTSAAIADGSEATPKQLAAVADTMRGCARELARIGVPGPRLRPVHALVSKACQQYGKVAACYDVIAAPPRLTGNPQRQLRAINEAEDCITAGTVNAVKLMLDAQERSLQLRAESGEF